MSFSSEFLRAVTREIARTQRRLDQIDARMERARRGATKDRLTAERAETVRYEHWLRQKFRP